MSLEDLGAQEAIHSETPLLGRMIDEQQTNGGGCFYFLLSANEVHPALLSITPQVLKALLLPPPYIRKGMTFTYFVSSFNEEILQIAGPYGIQQVSIELVLANSGENRFARVSETRCTGLNRAEKLFVQSRAPQIPNTIRNVLNYLTQINKVNGFSAIPDGLLFQVVPKLIQ